MQLKCKKILIVLVELYRSQIYCQIALKMFERATDDTDMVSQTVQSK